MELDPEEEVMTMKLAEFFWDNINYDLYYTPGDFFQCSKFWLNVTRSVGLSKNLNPRCFGYGNFEYDPYGELYRLFKALYLEFPEKFRELLEELIKKLQLPDLAHEKPYQVSRLNRYLSVFGWEINQNYELVSSSELVTERRADRHLMFSLLNIFPSEKEALQGAIERYSKGGTDAFRQCLDSCRNAIENLVKRIVGVTDWNEGLKQIVPSEGEQKLVKQVYNFLSKHGVHGTAVPTQEDTDLGLKLTEDCVVWILKKASQKSHR